MPTIRTLTPADADVLFAIETSATAHPWSLRQFVDGLAGGEFGWGIAAESELVGFALFNAVIDEATLLDVAVLPSWRRSGLARELLDFALQELAAARIARCLLEVRIGNAPAIALYKALGFIEDGRRRNYYPVSASSAVSEREDALLMSYNF